MKLRRSCSPRRIITNMLSKRKRAKVPETLGGRPSQSSLAPLSLTNSPFNQIGQHELTELLRCVANRLYTVCHYSLAHIGMIQVLANLLLRAATIPVVSGGGYMTVSIGARDLAGRQARTGLLDKMRNAIRRMHYSRGNVQAIVFVNRYGRSSGDGCCAAESSKRDSATGTGRIRLSSMNLRHSFL